MKMNIAKLKEKGLTVEVEHGDLYLTVEPPHVPNKICEQVGNLALDIYLDLDVTYEELEAVMVSAIQTLITKHKVFELLEESDDEN